MDRAEFIELAAPTCQECDAPVERVEIPWALNGDGDWVPGPSYMVCGAGHRVLVEPL